MARRPKRKHPPDCGPGRRLGVDAGGVRVGVAVSDADAMLATPVRTVYRADGGSAHLDELAALCTEYGVVEVVLGLPRSLDGSEGPAAAAARRFAAELQPRVSPAPVRLVDERLTTVSAARTLSEQGRRAHQQRPVIDQVAAVEILQNYLDQRRTRLTSS